MLETASYATGIAMDLVTGTGDVISKARSIVSGDAQFFSVAPKIGDLRYALAAPSVHEKRDAMKKIVAQMCKGADMHALFPDVVKNIHVSSMELRKLIYLFVVHYADVCPNEALLATSAFQKDLVDPSMHVRSLALRTLSSMPIPAIHPVVMVAVRKCSTDSSPLVRKTAAIALWQVCCVAMRETDLASVYDVLAQLLADKNADVVGAAVMTFERICPHRTELLHPVYRHLCDVLPDCEEWGQAILLRVLLRYARGQFCDPAQPAPTASPNGGDADQSSDSGATSRSSSTSSSSSSSSEGSMHLAKPTAADEAILDADHQLLLTAARPLLFSLSASVVVGVCALYSHAAPPRYLDYCVKPLMRVLRSAEEGHGIVLNAIYTLLERRPQAFAPYIKEFYVLLRDSADVRAVKHRVLARLAEKENLLDLSQEYKCYLRAGSEESVVEAVRGLGLVVARHPSFSALTMRLLTPLLSHHSQPIVTEAVAVLRLLIAQGRDSSEGVRLVFRLMQEAMDETITVAPAVSTILWLVGECLRAHPAIAAAAPDCFRVFVKRFSGLPSTVKQEVLTLGCKVWLALEGTGPTAERFHDILLYALELARYDADYAIRDHARLVESAQDRASPAFTAVKAALEAERPPPCVVDPLKDRTVFELGTLSNYFGTPTFAYEPLPEWATQPSDPSLRRPPRGASDPALWTAPRARGRAGGAGRSAKGRAVMSSSSDSSSGSSRATSVSTDEDSEARVGRAAPRSADGSESGEADTSSGHSSETDASAGPGRATERRGSRSSSSNSSSSSSGGGVGGPRPPAKPTAVKIVIKRA